MTKAFSPIKIGHLKLHSNVVQGPLAGYSLAPFRTLTWRYGKPGFCATEMISSKDLVYRQEKPKRFLYRDPNEGPLCFQICGNDVKIIGKATAFVTLCGADIVDLNCGCPVGKIRTKGQGSKLLIDPDKIYHLISAMKANTDAVVSIKIRVANANYDHDNIAVAKAAESAGADFITVHGRHWTQRYDVPCQHEPIQQIVSALNIPVFANGDVEDINSLKHIFANTGCHGVMIARASVGRPWLFEEIRQQALGENFLRPDVTTMGEIFLEHILGLIALQNEKLAVLQSRKLAKYYARYIRKRSEFTIKAQQAEKYLEVQSLVKEYFN